VPLDCIWASIQVRLDSSRNRLCGTDEFRFIVKKIVASLLLLRTWNGESVYSSNVAHKIYLTMFTLDKTI
jgi:hypothetical protein